MRKFTRGDFVVYYEPAPRRPALVEPAGGGSAHFTTHYLTVRESSKKGTLVLQAHSGQLIVTHNQNPDLRRARWWERLVHGSRFPRLERLDRKVFAKNVFEN